MFKIGDMIFASKFSFIYQTRQLGAKRVTMASLFPLRV
jgi:hypothetical protein